jgi:hypothetical protein
MVDLGYYSRNVANGTATWSDTLTFRGTPFLDAEVAAAEAKVAAAKAAAAPKAAAVAPPAKSEVHLDSSSDEEECAVPVAAKKGQSFASVTAGIKKTLIDAAEAAGLTTTTAKQ